MRFSTRRVLVVLVASWMAAIAPAAAGHHDRSGYTTLAQSACTFTAGAHWTGHANTTQVKFQLGANFGDGPVTVAFSDATPTFDGRGNGSAAATWMLSSAPEVGFFWAEAWLMDADGNLLAVLTRKSAKPLRAWCA